MAVWADNIKFVKDIIDTKFGKIDQAVQEVGYRLRRGAVSRASKLYFIN